LRIGARLEGGDLVKRRLRDAGVRGHAAAQREVRRSALIVQGGAKQRAPVDTGRLRNSIAVEVDADGLGATVGTNVEYAPFQEFGTRTVPAHPFLFPALEEHRQDFVSNLSRALDDAMEGR
jgi:HK97 gp10 family phage protein